MYKGFSLKNGGKIPIVAICAFLALDFLAEEYGEECCDDYLCVQ